MNLEAWRRRARQLSAQTYALYLAYRHPKTPWYAKVFAALIVGYVFSPIDPIPDFIPGVGLLDEMVVVPIGVLIAAKMIPREVNHRLLHELRYLDMAVVHVDPLQEAGEGYHRVVAHSHDGLPPHSH